MEVTNEMCASWTIQDKALLGISKDHADHTIAYIESRVDPDDELCYLSQTACLPKAFKMVGLTLLATPNGCRGRSPTELGVSYTSKLASIPGKPLRRSYGSSAKKRVQNF